MERTAYPAPPIQCFGLEQFDTNRMCQNCQHRAPCAKLMGSRIGKIALDKVRVNLIPKGFDVDVSLSSQDGHRIEIIYQECYSAVFGGPSSQSVGHRADEIIACANTAGVSLRMYIMTIMVAHKENDQRNLLSFFPGSLVGAGKIKTVELYAKVCRSKYASFHDSDCDQELELLTGVKVSESLAYRRMVDSETIVGEFIVGFKTKHQGYPSDILYERRELGLDPLWLATEQTYYDEVLAKFIPSPFGTEAQRRHRYSVLRCVQQMKRRKPYAISVYEARTKAVVSVLPTILSRFGLQATDMEVVDKEVTDSFELWYQIGLCCQHLECLKFTFGLKNSLAVNRF